MQEALANATHPCSSLPAHGYYCQGETLLSARACIPTEFTKALSAAAESCLYCDDDSCGKVRDPHSRVGGVDMLTSCTSCPVGVDPQVLVPHRHIDLQASSAP